VKLAITEGFESFSEAEIKLLREARMGKIAYCGPSKSDEDPENDPSTAHKWLTAEARQIRAELIRWLWTDRKVVKLIDPNGVQISAALVVGNLDLDFVSVPFPFRMLRSRVTTLLSMRHTELKALDLGGTWTGPIRAEGIKVSGNVSFNNGFSANGEVDLTAATIGGDLICERGTFKNGCGTALDADRIRVMGCVFLRHGFSAEGVVRLPLATVGGHLECDAGTFSNHGKLALNCNGSTVTGGVFLRCGIRVDGRVEVRLARIGGDLDCQRANFGPNLIDVERTNIGGSLIWTELGVAGADGKKEISSLKKGLNVGLNLNNVRAASLMDDAES
jgi:hypothetical protein